MRGFSALRTRRGTVYGRCSRSDGTHAIEIVVLSGTTCGGDACGLDQPTSAGGYRVPERRDQGAARDAWRQASAIHRPTTSPTGTEGASPVPLYVEGTGSSRHPRHLMPLVPKVRRGKVRQQRASPWVTRSVEPPCDVSSPKTGLSLPLSAANTCHGPRF